MKKICLTKGKYALVDDEDFKWLSEYKWSIKESKGKFYACNHKGLMHRLIMKLGPYKNNFIQVDHINQNSLDNRKTNLRLATQQQNNFNRKSKIGTSKYKGVYKKPSGNWCANIHFNRKTYCLGTFPDEKEAAVAYDNKARELFGEHAWLNFPNLNRLPIQRRTFKSPYRGIFKNGKKYTAKIQVRKSKQLYLGNFDTPEDAARAFDTAVKKFNSNSKLNFPDE